MSEEIKDAIELKKEDWMNSKWRPMMGWMYMVVCMFDMILFPILWSLLQATTHGSVHAQWNPLTLQGAGLFHIAMGAVLGIAAFGRTQEKLNGANNGGAQTTTPTSSFGTPNTPSTGFGATSGFGTSSTSVPPAPTTSFAPAPSWGTTSVATKPVMASSGKLGPAAPAEPEL
jgi:hypothetical protein